MEKEKKRVKEMFNKIAPTYDLLNRVLSLGIDQRWRKKLVKEFKGKQIKKILDVATGTADLAIALARLKPEKIFGIDIAKNMLEIGKQKVKKNNLQGLIELLEGDSENIPFEDETFDLVTCAFGVRNFENLEKGLKEMYRVTKKNGYIAILEFSSQRNKIFDIFFRFYFHRLLPFLGKMISKDKVAYEYLPNTVEKFPSKEAFCKILEKVGFSCLKYQKLTFGISLIYYAKK